MTPPPRLSQRARHRQLRPRHAQLVQRGQRALPHLLRTRGATPARGDRQALANLGFVVVTIDGRGTPGRSKSFHDAYYGAMGRDNTIPDQVAGMKELAQR